MKSLSLLSLASLALLAACTATTTDTTVDEDASASSMGQSMEEHNTMSAGTSSTAAPEATTSSVSAPADTIDARIIEMTATTWSFTPNTITAKKGEKIVVRLTNDQGVHSFGIKDLGINVSIQPGETKDVEIPTDTAGTFAFRCMIPCGDGHKEMTGTIVIEA